MIRLMFGVAVAAIAISGQAVNAQVISQYGGSGVYVPGSTYAAPLPQSSGVTSAYYSAPAYTTPAYVAPAPAYVAPVYSPRVYAAPVYTAPVYVAPSPVVVQMAYSVPAPVYAPVVAAPVVVAPVYGPNYVTQRTRALPNNFTQVTRVYGPTPGPHFSRVHVHNGPFGTTVREVVR